MKLVRRFLDLPAFLIGVFFLYWYAPAACMLRAGLPQALQFPAWAPCSWPAPALRRQCVHRSLPLAVFMNHVKFWKLTGECASLLVHANSNARHPVALGGCLTNPEG